MKIIVDFVTNSSETDYCDCSDCSYCNCFCRQCVCSNCRYSNDNDKDKITDKRQFFPIGNEGNLLYKQWLKDLANCG